MPRARKLLVDDAVSMKLLYYAIALLEKMAIEDAANNEHPDSAALVDWSEEYDNAQEARLQFMEHYKVKTFEGRGKKA